MYKQEMLQVMLFLDNIVDVLPWPENSPDFKITENVPFPSCLQRFSEQFQVALADVHNAVVEFIQNLHNNIPKRCITAVEKAGEGN